MKKEINKIIMVLGFILVVVGAIVSAIFNSDGVTLALSTANIAAALATSFIFAKNATVKNVGYTLGAITGSYGVACITVTNRVGIIISSVGMIFLLLASFLYLIIITLKFFGFVKGSKNTVCGENISDVLINYKTLQEEKVISEEEFNELKRKALEMTSETATSIDELKKWKKLLDRQVITEDEFAAMKAKVFKK